MIVAPDMFEVTNPLDAFIEATLGVPDVQEPVPGVLLREVVNPPSHTFKEPAIADGCGFTVTTALPVNGLVQLPFVAPERE